MRVYTIENIRRLLQHGVLTRLEMRIGTKQRPTISRSRALVAM